jgi:hypothetical protein
VPGYVGSVCSCNPVRVGLGRIARWTAGANTLQTVSSTIVGIEEKHKNQRKSARIGRENETESAPSLVPSEEEEEYRVICYKMNLDTPLLPLTIRRYSGLNRNRLQAQLETGHRLRQL